MRNSGFKRSIGLKICRKYCCLEERVWWEDPDIVISSIRGDFQAQLRFHESLAGWLAGKDKRLVQAK